MVQTLNTRAMRAREALIGAAHELVSQRPVAELTVKEVAEAAGVSRQTFYQHFDDIPALVAEASARQQQAIFARIDEKLWGTDTQYLRKLLKMFVDEMYADRAYSRNAIHGSSAMKIATDTMALLDRKMRDHVTGRLMGEDTQQVSDRRAAIAAGLVFMVFTWMDSDFTGPDAPEAMAERLADTLIGLAGIDG